MYRLAPVLTLALHGVAAAQPTTPAPLDSKLVAQLARAGWKDSAALTTTAAFRVVAATKGRERHLVLVDKTDKLIDAGTLPAKDVDTATVVSGPILWSHTQLQLSHQTQRAAQGWDQRSWIWIVREDGSLGCKLEGSSSSSSGTACGSSGWTKVTLKAPTAPATGGLGVAIDVEVEHTGTWSAADAAGKCVQRSPVRSGPMVTRYVIPEKGMCKQVAK